MLSNHQTIEWEIILQTVRKECLREVNFWIIIEAYKICRDLYLSMLYNRHFVSIINMIICKHSEWLHVTSEKKIALINTDCLTRIVRELTNSTTQQLSVLLFIGWKVKNLALRELFSNHVNKERNEDIVTLRVDNTSLYFDHLMLFVKSDSSATIISVLNAFCHEIESFSVRWANVMIMLDVYDILHARIFCFFSDVLCIFVDDFLNFKSVVNHLKIWVIVEIESSFFKQVRSSVVIVKRDDETSASSTLDLLEMQDVQFSLNQKILKNFYSFIKILHLTDEQIFSLTRFWRLKKLLWRQMNEMWNVWLCYWCLYSIVHLNKFFQIVISQTAVSALRSFNFVTTSQLDNEVDSNHFNHLTSFLWFEMYHDLSNDIMTSFIASSIVLNVYSLNMHRECCTDILQITSWFRTQTLIRRWYMMSSIISHVLDHSLTHSKNDHMRKKRSWSESRIRSKVSKDIWSRTLWIWRWASSRHKCIERTWMILTYHDCYFRATASVFDVFVESQRTHSSVNMSYVMCVYESTKMRCSLWIVNIILRLVFYVVLKIASWDLNLSSLTNECWLSMRKARMMLFH